jgi:hypothetical protein
VAPDAPCRTDHPIPVADSLVSMGRFFNTLLNEVLISPDFCYNLHGNAAERYRSGRNGVDSKSTCPVKSRARGFESHPLRHRKLNFVKFRW